MVSAQPGDHVIVKTKKEEVEGILLPGQKEETLILKLKSGYNMGIDKKKILSVVVSKKQEKKPAVSRGDIKQNKRLPTISILHTGGTIASKVDYTSGGVIASFTAEDFLTMFPEIEAIANIRTVLIDNLMSEDMIFAHYRKIAKAIAQEIEKGVDGIIIGHGTDTLALSTAALAFMIESPPIPIILVGAQRSSDRPSTDAAINLLSAATFITSTDFAGVALCMHETMDDNTCYILPPTKSRKMHTTRRDAFKPIGANPIARVNYETKKVVMLQPAYLKRDAARKPVVREKMEEKVGILRVYPSMKREVIDTFTSNKYRGLVLEGTGLGHAPTNIPENLPNYEALKAFIASGGIIVLTSQCIFGRVNRDVYTNTRRLGDIGIIYGEDMLTETAFIKLAWLLGNYSKEEVRKLLTVNLRGEISDRTLADWGVPDMAINTDPAPVKGEKAKKK